MIGHLFDPGVRPDPKSEAIAPSTWKLARASDHETSRLGAEDAASLLPEMQARALEAVRAFPGRTQMELARLTGSADRAIGRRLNELVKAGLVSVGPARRCSVTGATAGTYTAS